MNFFSKEHTRFIKSLIANKVKFMIVGGMASMFYGVRRNTGDLDIFIEPDAENGERLIEALKELKLKLPEIKKEEFEKELVLAFGFEPDAVDIINHAPGIEFETAYKHAQTVTLSKLKVKMIDIHDLIKNKEHLKRKGEKALLDKFDVKSLKKILRQKNS